MRINGFFPRLRLPVAADTAVGRFAINWRRDLLACLPARLRRWLLRGRIPRLLARVQGNSLALLNELDGEWTAVGRLDINAGSLPGAALAKPAKGWREVSLELPAPDIVVRDIVLPAQVKDNLLQVVGYEINRFTPFEARELYYDVGAAQPQASGPRLAARLALCRRDRADPFLAALRQQGIEPGRLTWPGAWADANLLPREQRPRRRYLGTIVVAFLVVVIILLLAAVMISPLTQKERQLEQLERVRRSVQVEAEELPKLREELERARAGSVAVLDQKASQPRMIDLLQELTDRLPDDTWVQTVNVRGNEVDIRGESNQATELLGLLGQAPGISEVSFRSPVMQVANTGKERFHIAFRYQRPPA